MAVNGGAYIQNRGAQRHGEERKSLDRRAVAPGAIEGLQKPSRAQRKPMFQGIRTVNRVAHKPHVHFTPVLLGLALEKLVGL